LGAHKPIEFVVPAGTGGGADQMARFLPGVIAKHNLSKQPFIVVNKSGGAGAEGFLDVKGAKGDPHKIVITLSNLFTTPLATGVPVQLEGPDAGRDARARRVRAVGERRRPTRRAGVRRRDQGRPDGSSRWPAPGSKQEDQIITVALEKATGKKMTYVPFKGGGDVAVQLVGKHVDSTVNNPIEAVAHWRSGALRPLCVFDSKPMPYPNKVTARKSWQDIPDVQVAGPRRRVHDAARYLHAGRRAAGRRSTSTSTCSRRCASCPEWKKYAEDAAFNTTFMTGKQFTDWVANAENDHTG
jgi:tripartite-type tricarboxylate transporter receptor subunit TctC